MKIKILFGLVGLLLITVTLVYLKEINAFEVSNYSQALTLKVDSQKDLYLLGEVVQLNVSLANQTDEIIKISSKPTVENGYLKIWISKDNKEFKEYKGNRWGLSDRSGSKILNPDQSIKSQVTVLWNYVLPIEYKDKIVGKDKLESHYAMPEPGIYYVKAVANLLNKKERTIIESETIEIKIEEPQGDDLEVWTKIKEDGKFARFIQEGEVSIPQEKTEERVRFQAEIEQILIDFPNSFYSTSLRQSLNKFRANESKRQEFVEKLRAKP
jgi:hypothetical protein